MRCGSWTCRIALLLAAMALARPLPARPGDANLEPRDEAPAGSIGVDLETALGVAITNNFELKVIKAQKGIQDLAVAERWRDYFPSLTFSYMETEEQRLRDTDTRLHKLSVDSRIVVYDGGQRGLAYDTARLKSVLARNDYRIALNRFISDMTGAFYKVLYARETMKIHKKTLENAGLQLGFIRKELELGDATKLDAMAIEAQVKEAELNVEKAKDEYTASLNRLKLLMKIDWRAPLFARGDIERDFELKPIEQNITEDLLVSLALKNRKEVESADTEFLISRKTYQISKNSYYPKFSLGVNYSYSGEEFMPRERGWGVNLEASSLLWGNSGSMNTGYNRDKNNNSTSFSNSESVNVLDTMSYRRGILESTINMKASKEKKGSVRQEIALEVSSTLSALNNAWRMIGIAKKQVELYDSFLSIERLKANMGESRRYDLVKKELERGEAAISLLNALISYITASAGLELSVGVDIGSFRLTRMRSRR